MTTVPGRTRAAIVLMLTVCAWTAAATVIATPARQRKPTFVKDIAPIVFEHCTPCHRPGQAAPFQLLSYDDVHAKGAEIAKATQAHLMPPWQAIQGPGLPPLMDDRRLTDKQIAAIAKWVDNGMPPGDLRRALPPPGFDNPWPLGLPDVTLALPRLLTIPAGGSSEFHNVVIPLNIPADVWISAIDYLPAEGSRLRHARFLAAPADLDVADDDLLPGVGGLFGRGSLENYGDQLFAAAASLIDLGGWTPGLARRFLPNDLSIRVPARSSLIVQMHFAVSDVDAIEDGTVAIYFSKPTSRRAIQPLPVPPAFGIAAGLSIPPGDAHYVLSDSFMLPIDVDVVGARGLANNLAREMVLKATWPAGVTRGLLRISPWDPDWPDSYYFATPVKLPKGSTIHAAITYDNSAANPRNLFTPPRRIGWGRLSVGEMGSVILLIATPATDADGKTLAAAIAQHLRDQLLKR